MRVPASQRTQRSHQCLNQISLLKLQSLSNWNPFGRWRSRRRRKKKSSRTVQRNAGHLLSLNNLQQQTLNPIFDENNPRSSGLKYLGIFLLIRQPQLHSLRITIRPFIQNQPQRAKIIYSVYPDLPWKDHRTNITLRISQFCSYRTRPGKNM